MRRSPWLTPIHPSRVRLHTRGNGDLSVECWCRQMIVYVSVENVRRGKTGSCGKPGCYEDQDREEVR